MTESSKPDGLSRSWRLRLVPWIAGLLTTLATLAHRLADIPLNRLFERNLCIVYYEKHDPSAIDPTTGDVPEELCKGIAIQEQLAFYIGLITTLELVFELLAIIPLGYVSDKFGRKLVLLLSSTGPPIALSWYMLIASLPGKVPLGVVGIAPILFLVTGGVNVLSANINAICSDVARDDAQRTRFFSWIESATQVISLLGPAISSAALSRSIRLPIGLGIASFVAMIPVVLFLPDTRRSTRKTEQQNERNGTFSQDNVGEESEPLIRQDPGENHSDRSANGNGSASHNPEEVTVESSLYKRIREWRSQLRLQWRDIKQLVTSSKDFAYCLSIFLVTTLARTSLNILLQYISKRYHKTFSQAGYVLSLKAAVNIVLFALIIPGFLYFNTHYARRSAASANLQGIRISLAILFLGVLLFSFSVKFWMLLLSLVVYSLGFGLSTFALTTITAVTVRDVGDAFVARTYSTVAFVETIALVAGSPLLASLWIGGLKIGGFGMGLPWWFSGALYLAALLVALKLRV